MAISAFGNSYAAQSLGLSANATGGQDIGNILKNQLADQAKKLQARKQRPVGAASQALGLFNPSVANASQSQ